MPLVGGKTGPQPGERILLLVAQQGVDDVLPGQGVPRGRLRAGRERRGPPPVEELFSQGSQDMAQEDKLVTGGCLCGGVRYSASSVGSEVTECHCSQCRRQAGHRHASVNTADDLAIEGLDGVTWFSASPAAERGFCSTCGSHLFWREAGGGVTSVAAASLDDSFGLWIGKHIFVESKAPYYEIEGDAPRFRGYDQALDGEA